MIGGGGRKMTSTARVRRWRAANPLRYCWQALKDNAKRRGKNFTLSLREFEKFCDDSSYLEKRGREAEALTVDRIINKNGYEKENIQAMTNSDNARKNNQCPF